MNREIKFRAWDGGMFEDVVVLSDDTWADDIVRDNWHRGNVMQYTGLKDKNGKEIYEGDVLESLIMLPSKPNDKIKGVVTWNEKKARWCVIEITAHDEPDGEHLFECLKPYFESVVIGNIHQNPELIKQEAVTSS